MNLTKTALLLAASIAVGGVYAPAFAEEAAPAKAAENATSYPAIRVTEVKQRRLVDRVIVTGTIEAVEEVYVQPQVDGLRIEELKADVGDSVKAGDVLATLSEDSLLLQKSQLMANRAKVEAVGAQMLAQLAEAKANEAEALRQADRAEKLVRSKAIAVSQAEQLRATAVAASARVNSADQAINANKADLKVVDSQVEDIDLKLARTDVKATVAGVIAARNAKIGAIAAGAGNPLFTLIRDNAIELKADVAEGDLLKVQPGQVVNIAVAGTNTKVMGKVRSVDPVISATTRLGSVKISIDDPRMARIGMYASAEVIVSERDVLSLPMTAVNAEDSEVIARKVTDGVVSMAKVTTGVQDGDFIEIVAGLNAKDLVVEKAGAYVRDGDHVSPVFNQNAASN